MIELNYDKDLDSIGKEPSLPEIGEMVGAGRTPGERPLVITDRPFAIPEPVNLNLGERPLVITDRRESPAPYAGRLKEFGKRVSRYLLEKLEKALDYPPDSYSSDYS